MTSELCKCEASQWPSGGPWQQRNKLHRSPLFWVGVGKCPYGRHCLVTAVQTHQYTISPPISWDSVASLFEFLTHYPSLFKSMTSSDKHQHCNLVTRLGPLCPSDPFSSCFPAAMCHLWIIPVGKYASMVYLLSQPTIQLSRYVQVCLQCACVYCCWCSVWRIRPQKMLIRVDLGTWSCRLMDRVQGQTSPWGAMILSLIVHTHLPSPLTLPPSPLTHTPLLYTHHRQNKSVSDTTGKKRRWE